MLNRKSVLRTATVRNASVFTFKNATKVMMVLFFMALIAACAKEQLRPAKVDVGPLPQDTTKVIIDHFANSSRSLFVNATPKDSFCYSEGVFDMYSTMSFTDDDNVLYDMKLKPTANVRIKLTPARQEVKSEVEIPTTKVSSKTISQSKTNNGLVYVFKKHQQDTYADGSKADIYLEWTARGYLSADGDTLMTGHVEFGEVKLDSISYARHGQKTEYDDPFYVTHHYTIPYMEKGVTGQQRSFVLPLKPYREKSITDDPQVKTGEPTYKIDWVGCPVTKLNLVQTTPTNKGVVTVTESFDVVFKVTVPEEREQASLDSLFSKVSEGGKPKYEAIGDTVKHANGFQSLNYAGGYTSRNKGTENGSNVETTATITASMPVKFANKWGSVDIKPLEPTFEEGGFVVTSVSQDADYHMFKTVNTIIPHLGDCTMDALDEVVNIKVAKDKPAVPVDSVYVKGGKGDSYTVTKTVYYSDGSKLEYPFAFDGKHSASASNFGEKVVSNLSWSASELKDNGTSQVKDNGKVFTPTTRFEVTYVTTNKKSDATNNVESGSFGFSETHPVVVFVDGQTKLTFDERKVVLSGKGAQPANNYTLTVKDGVSYKGYTYNMTAGVVFDGEAEADVTSQGLLLMVADEVGDAVYKYDYVWSGNTITVTTTKTIPHTFAEDEVETYQTSYTVSMTDLQDGRVDAENTAFTVVATPSEKSLEPVKDGFYTISPRERSYTYVVSNGSASRQMSNTVTDAVIAFNDGKGGSHTWDVSLNVTKADNFGSAKTEGDYTVTPLTTTVTAVASGTGAPTITKAGVTSIYVQNIPVQYRLRGEYVETVNGYTYYNVYAEKSVDGGSKWTEMDKMEDFVAERHGKWKPNVTAQIVSTYEFTTHDTTKSYDVEPKQTERGTNKRFDIINVSKIEYFWKALFPAPVDADGNNKRDISGSQVQWVNKLIYHNPETGEEMPYEVKGGVKTSTHEVKDGVYTRIVDIYCQDQIVESQKGTVALELVQ